MNGLPQNVLLNFRLEFPKSDLTIYLLPGISEIFCQMVGTPHGFEILENDLFQDNFTMALYSFGGGNDQCRATSSAVQETGMLSFFLSCDSDMTA